MGGWSFLDLEKRKLIEFHLRKGESLSETARIINKSKNCVITEVRRAGGKDSYNAENAQMLSEETKKEKYLKIHRKLSEEEQEKINDMAEGGVPLLSICKDLNISFRVLKTFLSKSLFKQKNISLVSLYQRVEIIEEQLKILVDYIKENK